jgi:type IV secretion system protein VirD4
LGGHRSRVFFSGVDDPSTLEYVSRVAGTSHVGQRGWSADTTGGRKTVSEHPQREDLLPAHVIRQMRRQDAVLLHGTLPPIHLRLIRWWEDPDLKRLVPTGRQGRSLDAPSAGTCPMAVGGPRPDPEPTLDRAVIAESLANLPRPGSLDDGMRLPRTRPAVRRGSRHTPAGQLDLGLDNSKPVTGNRYAANCERCGARVPVGAGRSTLFGSRTVVFCDPICPRADEKPGHGPNRE